MNNPYENFRWLIDDIDYTLTFSLYYGNEMKASYNIHDIYEADMEKLKVIDANIDDITDLLTICIVRFEKVGDSSEIIDIPFRKLHLLYDNGNVLGNNGKLKKISLQELEAFSVSNGEVLENGDYFIVSYIVDKLSDELRNILEISKKFGNMGMQDTFNALCMADTINQRRMKSDKNK